MSTTQDKTDDEYMSLVEADKRSILEHLLTFDYDSLSKDDEPSTNPEKFMKLSNKPINEENVKKTLEEEYAKIFGDVDIDDSEEIFNNLLKKVEEEFKRLMELKKKNPFLAATMSAAEERNLKPERRAKKRKPKAFEKSLKVMDNFKKRLLENPPEPEKSSSNFSGTSALIKSSKNTYVPFRSQSISEKLKSSLKAYPKWKTTSTYTPIFSAPINPNWASIPTNIEEKELLSQKTANKNKMITSTPFAIPTPNELGLPSTMNLSKMYTSTQIRNWVHCQEREDNYKEVNNEEHLLSSSNKTFRTDQSICNSANNDAFSSPMKSPPTDMNTPIRDTVVRFRPSPPQCFLFSSDGNSSVSSSSPIIDYKDKDVENTDFNACNYIPEEFVYYENEVENEEVDYFNGNCSPITYPENCYSVMQPVNQREPQQFIDFKGHHHYFNNCQSNKIDQRVLNNTSKQQTVPSDDFVRNLHYSININYNIINNYKS